MHWGCSHRSSAQSADRADSSRAAMVNTCGARWQLATQPLAEDLVVLLRPDTDDFLIICGWLDAHWPAKPQATGRTAFEHAKRVGRTT